MKGVCCEECMTEDFEEEDGEREGVGDEDDEDDDDDEERVDNKSDGETVYNRREIVEEIIGGDWGGMYDCDQDTDWQSVWAEVETELAGEPDTDDIEEKTAIVDAAAARLEKLIKEGKPGPELGD